jgi:hypothetical protein
MRREVGLAYYLLVGSWHSLCSIGNGRGNMVRHKACITRCGLGVAGG